ncbi:MAG TPA: inorganic diphosphatase [Candidatus Eisenbacteria bacterium]|jgi:inorganic pyrophosphatase|nr:inorganic diphosphatase [Candidatus Eisenbacteria bacterium]
MADLTSLPLRLDRKRARCRAIVESPQGSRCKFKYDPESGLFELDGLLPEGMRFPFDFGFVPQTLAEDGDPVDIVVLAAAPTHVGCLVDVRLIGVIEAKQTEKGKKKPEDNARLIGVAVDAYDWHEDLKSTADLSEGRLTQWREFFTNYDRQHGKEFRVTGIGGPGRALKHLARYRKKKS